MRLTVTRDMDAAPGGWTYTVPETGVTLKAPYAHTLRKRVFDHMTANSIPLPPDFMEWINDAICRESGHGSPYCGELKPSQRQQPLPPLSWALAVRFVSTILHAIKDRKFVSREEAERRIAVCMDCPLATSIGGCKGCSTIFRQSERVMKNYLIDTPREKEFCGACGCKLSYKVWIDNATLDKAEGGNKPDYAEGCWRLGKP